MELGEASKLCKSNRRTKAASFIPIQLELKLLQHTHTQCKTKRLTEDYTLILQLVEKLPVLVTSKQKETKFIHKKSPSKYKCKPTLEQFKAELMVKINHENPIKGNEDNISRVKSD